MFGRNARGSVRIFRALIPVLLVTGAAVGVVEPLMSQPANALTLLSITVAPTTASIAAGDTQQFTATGHYLGGSTADITDSVTWSSSLTSAATVSSTGLATGVATGRHHHHRHVRAHLGHRCLDRHPGGAAEHHGGSHDGLDRGGRHPAVHRHGPLLRPELRRPDRLGDVVVVTHLGGDRLEHRIWPRVWPPGPPPSPPRPGSSWAPRS